MAGAHRPDSVSPPRSRGRPRREGTRERRTAVGNSYFTMGDSLNGMRDAAIESTMHLLGIGGSVGGGFDGGNPPVRITPLGGHYEGSTFVNGGRVTDPTGQYEAAFYVGPEWPFHDLPSMVAYYDQRIDELFS